MKDLPTWQYRALPLLSGKENLYYSNLFIIAKIKTK